MSEELVAALVAFAFFAALAAWVPLLDATRRLLTAARRRYRIARLNAEALLPGLSR